MTAIGLVGKTKGILCLRIKQAEEVSYERSVHGKSG